MKQLLTLMIFFCMSGFIQAAKPIIEVPDIPQKSELELYEESEGLYSIKILEYFKMAVILETQIKLLGIDNNEQSKIPVFEELEDMDIKTLIKYHKIAKNLEGILKKAPDSDRQLLLEKINDLELRLRDTIAIYTIERGSIRNVLLDQMIARLQQIEKNHSESIEYVINQNYVNCMDYDTWFSVAGVSKIFVSSGADVVKNDPGIGLQVSLNIGKLTGFWDGFEARYEYLSPKLFTEYDYGDKIINRDQWSSNLNNISGGGKIILNKTPKLIQGFNIFAGYFWADGRIYNKSGSYLNWDGATFSIDYFLAAPSCKFPVEIFAGITVYHSFSRNLIVQTPVSGFELHDLGPTHLSFNFGLRYNIWRSPF